MRTFAQRSSFTRFLSQSLTHDFRLGRQHVRFVLCAAFLGVATLTAIVGVSGQQFSFIPNGTFLANPGGASETYSATGGGIDLTGPFFQSMGTNGRSCATCHQPSDAMSVAAANAQQRFDQTQGMDPIFRTVDGSNCNHTVDVSPPAGRSAAHTRLRMPR